MKIAIHHRIGSFSQWWINYCEKKQIPYKIVNCYKSDIIQQLEDCDVLMWHFHHTSPQDVIFAKQLLYSIQASGKKVFPDFNTAWHFDDKVGQKYLLESIGAPLVSSYVFYDKKEALRWVKSATFPKVFKLRRGAGAANVRLVRTGKEGIRLVKKAFGRGFRLYDPWGGIKERWRNFKNGKTNFQDLLEGIGRIFIRTGFEKTMGREKGYIYFQDFIEDCSFDIRVKVVGDKLQAFKRMVRKDDFRASGSGDFYFAPDEIPEELIKTAFKISQKLKLQSVAFDFLISNDNKCFLLEMSYMWGYADEVRKFKGYWDSDLKWHEENFNPYGWMVEKLIKKEK